MSEGDILDVKGESGGKDDQLRKQCFLEWIFFSFFSFVLELTVKKIGIQRVVCQLAWI